MRFVITLGICLMLAVPSYAGLYKWTDENGKVHFTNDPSQIPLDQRNKRDMKRLSSGNKGGKPSTPAPTTAAPKPDPARKKIKALKNEASDVDVKEVRRLRRLMQK